MVPILSFSLLSLSALLASLFHAAAAASDAATLESLTRSQASTRDSLLPLSVDQLRPIIETAHPSFALFVVFTADPKICQPCSQVRASVASVSVEYASLTQRKSAKHPVFFVEVKLSSVDTEFLSAYAVRHVPILYHFGTSRSSSFPKALDPQSPNSFNFQELGFGPNIIKQFVNKHTGAKLQIVRGGYSIPFVETVRSVMPIIFIIACSCAGLAVATGAYKNPMLWFALVVLVYIFSVGGGHYSWIHNTPLVVVNKDGHFEYIAGGSRSQYVAEGFFVSVTCVAISGLVILIQKLPSVLPNKTSQSAAGMAMVTMTASAISALLVLYQQVCFPRLRSLSSTASLSHRIDNRHLLSPNLTERMPRCVSLCSPFHRKCRNIFNTARCSSDFFSSKESRAQNFIYFDLVILAKTMAPIAPSRTPVAKPRSIP